MGVARYGPLGPFKGKIGPIFGYVKQGKLILRAAPQVVPPRSEKQKAVLQRMPVLGTFFQFIKPYLAIGFELSALRNGNSANNSAKSYNLKHAIGGVYPNQFLEYDKVRLTEGELAVAENAVVMAVADGFRFYWDYDEHDPHAGAQDKTMLMAFFPDKSNPVYLISGVERKAQTQLLEVPAPLKGLTAHTYISFVRDDRRAISNSVYTGAIVFS
ncbi:DUF6266 family protein [Pedobacter faecalis]|uniref:DUF6266 family protein n=1 Tax=Pedobacter faecalis TaxID=3041495 RepID=UPI00254F78EF|nr:DUF6266 family protein [Pedobacter sp. ELA7]